MSLPGQLRPTSPAAVRGADQRHIGRDVALIDLLDRLLAGGVVLGGDIVLAAADIDLVRVDLRALISSVPVGGSGASR